MKMDKDQIQKIGLSGLLLVGVVYCYFTMLLGPLTKRQTLAEARMGELNPKLEEARKQIKATQALEQQAPLAVATLNSINSLIPDGAPIAWFPPRIVEFFKRQGIDKAVARFANEAPEKELTGYRRLFWSIDLPKAGFVSLAVAVAGLENEEPLLEIRNLQIDVMKEDPQNQHVLLSVASLSKQ